MTPRPILILLVCFALLLVGCGQQQGTGDLTDPFIGGTEGMVMSFQEGAPQREIFDNGDSTFSVGIRLQNTGEADVGSEPQMPTDNRFAQIEIGGINPNQFANPITLKTFQGEGITMTRMKKTFDGTLVAGPPDVLLFDGFRYLPDNNANTQVTLRAILCYDYTTFSNTQVCMKSNTLETLSDNSICTLSGPRDVKNSGAPIHVTTVSQNPLGKNRIQVQFTIEKVGTGNTAFFAPSDHPVTGGSNFFGQECDNVPTNPNRNKVWVDVKLNDASSTALINCNRLGGSNQGMIELFGGAPAVVTCTLETPSGIGSQAYTDLLKIDLDYRYWQYIETPVLVRDVSAGQ